MNASDILVSFGVQRLSLPPCVSLLEDTWLSAMPVRTDPPPAHAVIELGSLRTDSW